MFRGDGCELGGDGWRLGEFGVAGAQIICHGYPSHLQVMRRVRVALFWHSIFLRLVFETAAVHCIARNLRFVFSCLCLSLMAARFRSRSFYPM